MEKIQLTENNIATILDYVRGINDIAGASDELLQQRQNATNNFGLHMHDVVEIICAENGIDIHTYWRDIYHTIIRYLDWGNADFLKSKQAQILQYDFDELTLLYDKIAKIVLRIQEYDAHNLHPYGRTGYGLVETVRILAMRDDDPVRAVCEIVDALLYQYRLYIAAGGKDVDFDFEQTCALQRDKYTTTDKNTTRTAKNNECKPQRIQFKIDELQQRKLRTLYNKAQTACKSGKPVKLFAADYTYMQFIHSVRSCDFSNSFDGGTNTNAKALLRIIYSAGKYNGICPSKDAYEQAAQSIGETIQTCNKNTSHSPVWTYCK